MLQSRLPPFDQSFDGSNSAMAPANFSFMPGLPKILQRFVSLYLLLFFIFFIDYDTNLYKCVLKSSECLVMVMILVPRLHSAFKVYANFSFCFYLKISLLYFLENLFYGNSIPSGEQNFALSNKGNSFLATNKYTLKTTW